jgi:hypothetical protein
VGAYTDVRTHGRTVALGLLVAASGALVGHTFWHPAAGTPRVARVVASAPTAPAPSGPGPTGLSDGMPAGFADTRPGAVAAAAAFVCSGQALLDMDPLSAETAVRQMAADATADSQVQTTLGQLSAARDALASGTGPIAYHQAAVAWRITAYDPARAEVAIWSVGVLSRAGVAPPQAAWTTSTFELVWERRDWKVWSETITSGPAPILNNSVAPATADQLAAATAGFTDFEGQP